MRPPEHDILFEPCRIGPVEAQNRFFQVPHCNGMGYRDPKALAAMRKVKAEGGWAVVCTEEAEIDPASDICPHIEMRLWDESDLPNAARVADAIHEHGALAGIELVHNGINASNHYTREIPIGPSHQPVAGSGFDPIQARAMDIQDIRAFRISHSQAVRHAIMAGFDLIYVYAGHGLTLIEDFLSPVRNQRSDEYGGSLYNRARLLREVVEDTLELASGKAAVAVRISIDSADGATGLHLEEVHEVIASMADLPDLWDFVRSGWDHDSPSARFREEHGNVTVLAGLKQLTHKPVVGVGRFTNVDLMARLVRTGVLDFIGAARPSIADPFLPHKIEAGRSDDIRECIGCNICVSGDFLSQPIRCTQNPTIGEEWRRGWHPERVRRAANANRVLIIGAGPAGLEAALVSGLRGYRTVLADQRLEAGGRVVAEARLPGLASWIRVRDYRIHQLQKLTNVELYPASLMEAEHILELGCHHVAIATGASWRADGAGRHQRTAIAFDANMPVYTPDDVMQGRLPGCKTVVIYDDDHYYMASVLAELLAGQGYHVRLVTPADCVAKWSTNTMEQHAVQARLLALGVQMTTNLVLDSVGADHLVCHCSYSGKPTQLAAQSLVLVTARLPDDGLFHDLHALSGDWAEAGIETVDVIGDARAPGTIAHATFAGRLYGEELGFERAPSRPSYLSKVPILRA